MKERPILFSAPMVNAILDGGKTQTRRAWKLPNWLEWDESAGGERKGDLIPKDPALKGWYSPDEVACPYGQVGDRLWVRETWRTDSSLDDKAPSQFSGWPVKYDADGEVLKHGAFFGNTKGRTRASIHMPRWASRINLEITGIQVERLQDISDDDCLAEGSENSNLPGIIRGKYKQLWESINGVGSWDANPWVWVIEFKRVSEQSK